MTLEDHVCLGGPMRSAEVVRVGIILLSALAASHDRNTHHGAIAPEHVFIVERDGLLLGAFLDDFGAAVPSIDDPATLGFARHAFVAPERLVAATSAEGAPTIASDLYALAAVLHFAATGTSPSTARRVAGAFDDAATRLARILRRAMHPEPEHRYASADEMITALLAIATATASASATVALRVPPPSLPATRRSAFTPFADERTQTGVTETSGIQARPPLARTAT